MQFQKIIMDDEIGLNTVTLSAAKGLSRWAEKMLRCAQHDNVVTHTDGLNN